MSTFLAVLLAVVGVLATMALAIGAAVLVFHWLDDSPRPPFLRSRAIHGAAACSVAAVLLGSALIAWAVRSDGPDCGPGTHAETHLTGYMPVQVGKTTTLQPQYASQCYPDSTEPQ